MSSTDERRVRRFFERHLVSAAEALRARGVRFFPLGPDPDSESWYVDAPDGPDFRTLESDDLEARLREQWTDHPELAALAGELMELARSLEVGEEDDGEISPFVYVMY